MDRAKHGNPPTPQSGSPLGYINLSEFVETTSKKGMQNYYPASST